MSNDNDDIEYQFAKAAYVANEISATCNGPKAQQMSGKMIESILGTMREYNASSATSAVAILATASSVLATLLKQARDAGMTTDDTNETIADGYQLMFAEYLRMMLGVTRGPSDVVSAVEELLGIKSGTHEPTDQDKPV